MLESNTTENLIREIQKLIKKDKLNEALEKCEKLMEYKPYSSKMMNTKAEILIKLEKWEEALSIYFVHLEERETSAYKVETIDEDLLISNELILQIMSGLNYDEVIIKRQEHRCLRIKEMIYHGQDEEKSIETSYGKLARLESKACEGELSEVDLFELGEQYFLMGKDMESLLCIIIGLKLLRVQSYKNSRENKNILGDYYKIYEYLIENFDNVPMVCRQFLEFDYPIIFVKDSEYDTGRVEIFAILLAKLGKEVWLIDLPLIADSEIEEYDPLGITEISFENIRKIEGVNMVSPINLVYKGKEIGCNLDKILLRISENSPREYCTFVCSCYFYESLLGEKSLKKSLYKIAEPLNYSLGNTNITIGHVGRYLEYLRQLYGDEAVSNLDKPPETKISVVIPCRNSAETLEYTLKTCLNQTIDEYEIVISDNSADGNTEIFDLIKKINDKKIQYYRAPYYLPLPRNFEFAYLMARGEFIFSVGSDDGVTFHGLNTLSCALDAFPDEDILQWDRGFYIWPNFDSAGQAGQFLVPASCKKNEFVVDYYDSDSVFKEIAKGDMSMYFLPMLYINSGFRKRYLKKLLEKSGRLLDGFSQDIFTGCAVLATNEKILLINACITFAGMSGSSLGAKSTDGLKSDRAPKGQLCFRENGFSLPLVIERLHTGYGDRVVLMLAVLQIINLNANPNWQFDMIDFHKMLKNLIEEHPYLSEYHAKHWETNAKSVLNLALNNDNELYKWLIDEIVAKIEPRQITPSILKHIEEVQNNTKLYEEGIASNGDQTFDSRKYGITNIYEACEFVQNLRYKNKKIEKQE